MTLIIVPQTLSSQWPENNILHGKFFDDAFKISLLIRIISLLWKFFAQPLIIKHMIAYRINIFLFLNLQQKYVKQKWLLLSNNGGLFFIYFSIYKILIMIYKFLVLLSNPQA